jgi:urease alpha subunit
VTFAAESAARSLGRAPGHGRPVVAIGRTRGLTRADLWSNRTAPLVDVDAGDGTVRLDGRVLRVDAVAELPLNRRYLLR